VRILVAEDEPVSLRVLQATLLKWNYEVTVARDGAEAWRALQPEDGPRLAILDWMMPDMDGLEICHRAREGPRPRPAYIILLTARERKEDVIAGLEAGANDHVTKPFDQEELRARVQVGVRVVELQGMLADRVKDLEEALTRVKQLRGLLPICAYCKKIRDDRNYWQQVGHYVTEHTEAQFSHGICPDCYQKVRQELRKARPQGAGGSG